jgi:tetratricopeptide (TPR) repeat protein
MYAVANLMEEGKFKEATAISAKLHSARGELDSTLYPFSARDSISRLNPELPVALRTADWTQVIQLSQSSEPSATQPNLRILARELTAFGIGMQAVDSRNLPKAQDSSAQFDAELWRITQQLKDAQGMTQSMTPNSGPSSSPRIPVMSDAYIEPVLRTLSVMSLELRGSILTAQKRNAEAKAVFAQAAREEKDLGYHEPPLYIRPVGEAEAAALIAAGDFAGAKAAYQLALTERPRSGFPLYGIALSAEKAGDLGAAAKEYSDFLNAWRNADADLVQVARARTYIAQHPAAARQRSPNS